MKLTVGPGGKLQHSKRKADALTTPERKRIILATVRMGFTVEEGCRQAGCSIKSHEYYRRTDPDYRDAMDNAIRAKIERAATNRAEVPDFPEFSERYLGMRLFRHHLQWVDLLEGREPRDLHPAQRYVQGDEDQILVNTPPEHAKSTTLTVNYVTWRIVQDPNIRILLVSKTQDMAKKFLFAVKQRLAESEAFADLQQTFGPPGGWAEGASTWTTTAIRVAGADSGEKDYTVEAVGIGGQIYGTRTDLVIMDDCVDNTNHQQFESQINWIQNIVGSRVADVGGRMLLIGTRMETVDLYSEILKPQYYSEGRSPWTYLTQPAVLEFAEDPKDWVTLWPRTNKPPVTIQARKMVQQDEDGLWPMWHGEALAKKRRKMTPRNWSMVYMQDQVSDDAIFKMEDVQGCIDRARYPGRMFDGQPQHRKYGMDGLLVVAGLDPAAAGCTTMVVVALDRTTRVRWLLDVVNKRGMPPHEMRSEIKRLTERYGISEWRVEKNAYQGSIVQDMDIRSHLNSVGCLMTPHHTDGKKWDTDFGVASMATLFEGWKDGRNLIRLPSQTQSESVRALIEQLCSWFPETKGLTDTVMALWFPLDVETPLWTASGWKTMGTVAVGDQVATQSGELARVAALTPIRREPVYRVTFTDGSSLRATAEHRWWVQPISKGSKPQPHQWMTTQEMAAHGLKRLRIDNPKAIQTPPASLPVDPYALGAWLGDGDARQGTIYGHDDDTPYMREQFEKAGYRTTDQKRRQCFGVIGLRGGLVRAGVLVRKHVPRAYLDASPEQRLALLQGLMDTDGTVIPGRARCYFANTNQQLAESVAFLARSLGFRVNIQHYPAGISRNPQGGDSAVKPWWRVLFTADASTPNPFRLPRKADRVTAFANDRKPRRHLILKSVEPDGEADVRCITVDHDSHVFLAGRGLVPTGNCEIRCRELVLTDYDGWHQDRSEFMSEADDADRMVIDIDFALQQQAVGAWDGRISW